MAGRVECLLGFEEVHRDLYFEPSEKRRESYAGSGAFAEGGNNTDQDLI